MEGAKEMEAGRERRNGQRERGGGGRGERGVYVSVCHPLRIQVRGAEDLGVGV